MTNTVTGPVYHEDWYSSDQLANLVRLLHQTDGLPGDVLEIGCWEGKSTIALASALGRNLLHVIDHWQGQLEAPETLKLAQERDVYAQFRANLLAAGVTNVVVHRGDWVEQLDRLTRLMRARKQGFRFCHLDGPHVYEAVCGQIAALLPLMPPGAILAGDDWGWEAVRQAVVASVPLPQALGNLWWHEVR